MHYSNELLPGFLCFCESKKSQRKTKNLLHPFCRHSEREHMTKISEKNKKLYWVKAIRNFDFFKIKDLHGPPSLAIKETKTKVKIERSIKATQKKSKKSFYSKEKEKQQTSVQNLRLKMYLDSLLSIWQPQPSFKQIIFRRRLWRRIWRPIKLKFSSGIT